MFAWFFRFFIVFILFLDCCGLFLFLLLFLASPSCCFFVISPFLCVCAVSTQPCPFPPCNEASSSSILAFSPFNIVMSSTNGLFPTL